MNIFDYIVDTKAFHAMYYLGKNISIGADFAVNTRSKAFTEFLDKYKWLKHTPRETADVKSLFKHRNPAFNDATFRAFTYLHYYITHTFKRIINKPEKFIWHEDLVSSEIFIAMDLVTLVAEALPIILPNMDSKISEHYIDVCENAGYPGDTCTLPKTTIGMVLDDELPPPRAIVTSNAPCDGGMASYAVMEEKYKVPVFRLDLPYDFKSKRGLEYFAGEVRRMIAWLEDVFSIKLDYDRLREVCEERNRAQMYAYDIWDLQRLTPAPIGGETIVLSHLSFQMGLGEKEATAMLRDIYRAAKRSHERFGGGIKNERHRYILWNPPPLVFPEIFAWMEVEYGAVGVMDMLSHRDHPIIDTATPETMIRDLTTIMAHGPMAQHTRGPYENFFDDLFKLYDRFDADMIIMAGHVGCKNTRAILGIFKELCRKRSIPLLAFDYDLSDTRPMSPDGIKKQIADFMENIMGERKSSI